MNLYSFLNGNRKFLTDNFNYKIGSVDYIISISDKYKFIYFETPKVACSTIKTTLFKAEGKEIKDIHLKKNYPLISPLKAKQNMSFYFDNYFSFAFVRNPYSRILSCYLDKIIGDQKERNIRLPKLGFKSTDVISFEEFLLAVKSHLTEDIHWMPQTILLSSKKINLSFIGKIENFEEDFSFVLSSLNIETNIKNYRPHSVSADTKLKEYLNEKTISLIKEIYYDDFVNYGYSFELF